MAPLPGRFQVALVTRLCGVSAPVGPRSDSGSRLFSGENQWLRRSSAFENVYEAVSAKGLVRWIAEKRMPWYHDRPSLVSTSMCRKPFGPGTCGLVRSAWAGVRTMALGFAPSAALSCSFGIGAGAFMPRNPCLMPRSRWEAREDVGERREQRIRRAERQRDEAVPAADTALDDRKDRMLLREAPEAAADRPLLIALRIPCEPDARVEVVGIGAGRPVG